MCGIQCRFSLSTFTRGSPRKPSWRPSVNCATSARTCEGRRCVPWRPAQPGIRPRRADMRIEPAGGSGDQIHGHGRLVVRVRVAQRLDARGHGFGERGIQRALVGAAGGASVVRVGRGGRGTAPEVLRIGERLTDQLGAHRLAVALDQAAVRLVGERDLRDAGDHQRIGDPVITVIRTIMTRAGRNSDSMSLQAREWIRGARAGSHIESGQASPTSRTINDLMPMNGTITPPTP